MGVTEARAVDGAADRVGVTDEATERVGAGEIAGQAKQAEPVRLDLEGVEYLLIAKGAYVQWRDAQGGDASERGSGARPRGLKEIARRLREARRAAGLSQVDLARKLGKSQAFVSQTENARVRVGDRYLSSVLRACGLPDDGDAGQLDRNELDGEAEDWAGLDPETLELVRRGSERDTELKAKYFWWGNRPF